MRNRLRSFFHNDFIMFDGLPIFLSFKFGCIKQFTRLFMKKLFFFIVFLLSSTNCFSQQKHSSELKDGSFMYDGKDIQVHSGETDFARVPNGYAAISA